MKKIHMFAALLAMLLPSVTWGASYTSTITAEANPSAGGTVFVNTSKSDSGATYAATSSKSATKSSSLFSSASFSFYLYAKPASGYFFKGWSETQVGGTFSSDSPYTLSFKNESRTKTYYAIFEQDTAYELTLVKPTGIASYTVTGPTGFNGSTLSNGGTATIYKSGSYTFNCTVSDGYEFVKWTVNGADAGTSATLTKSFTSDSTVQAVVNKLETYYATCLPASAGCSYKVGSTVVSSSEYQTSGYGTLTVNLSAPTVASGYVFSGWYTLENGVKTIISTDNSTTISQRADVTLGADFVAITAPVMLVTNAGTVDYDDFDAAFAAAKSGDKLKVVGSGTLAATTAVAAGVTLEVASGVTLTVASGATLYIDGSVTVNGTISGTVSKCTKLIQQTGNNGEPFNPYTGDEKYQVRYWKTAITTPSISVSSSTTHISIVNGLGETVYRGATANAFVCTTDKSVAINHIKSVKASYSSGTDAYNAVSKNSHNVSSASCNLMGSAASELVLLTAAGSVSVGSSTVLNSGFIADCAGYNISFTSKQFGNACNVITINGATVSCSKLTNARLTAINCTTVKGAGSDGINNNQASYYTSLHLYDCTSFSSFNFSASAVMTGGTPGVCFFSGGPYNPSFTGNYHVYGGTFSKDPTNYLASNDLEAPKEGNYWVVRVKKPTIYVAKVGATQYESLQEAVNAAAGGTVELLPGIATEDLSSPVTVASGKTVTIDLAGYAVTAPNGVIVNNGTLYLQDTSTFDVPGSLTTAGGNVIVNNGTLDVTYGAYTGNILLNGGTFTTHFGTFDGTISVASGLDPKVVANLRGGEFSNSVSSFLRDGYSEVYSHMDQNDPMRYWVVYYLTIVTPTSYSSTEKAWKLDFMSSSDLVIYKKTKSRSDHSSLADWQRRAELHSYVQPYSQYVLDCALIFDCPVAAGSVTFYGKAQVSMSESVGKDLAANEDFPALAHRIYEMNYTPLSYGRYIDEVGSVTAGVKNNSNANVGTVCTMDLRVCTQSKNTPGVYDKLKALVDVRYMLGGKKAAIDRGASRLAYDSLAAAVNAVQDGERVLVGADTAENVTLPNAAGEYIIDPYGFAFTGTVTAPEGLTVTSEEVASLATTQGVESAKAVKYTVAVPPSIATVDGAELKSWDAVVAAVNAAGGSSVAVVVTAPLEGALTLAAGKTLTVTVADGVTATVTVTPATGAFIETSTADGTTTYVSKKITVTMAEPQASVEVTKIENGTESEVTGAEATAAVATLVGNGDVPRTDNTDKLDVLDLVTVMPTKIVEEVSGGKTTIRSATFDVVPTYKGGQSLGEGQKLKFRLPVDAAAAQQSSIVYHGDAQFGIYPVQTENEEKFIEIASDAFSPYGYELLDGETANPIAAIGTTGYATLPDAIAAASNGDTITVFAGTFDIGSDTIVVNKEVTITGAGKDTTTLNSTATKKAAFSIRASNVTIENMTINQADTTTDNTHHIGIDAAGSDSCYSNVTISNLKLGGGKYSMIVYGESFTIDGCDFASQGSSQILVDATKGNSRITNNTFTGGKYNVLQRNSHTPTTVTSSGKLTISDNTSQNGNLLYILESASSIDTTQKMELLISGNEVANYTNKAIALTPTDELGKYLSAVTITGNAFHTTTANRPAIQRDDSNRSTLAGISPVFDP